MISTGLTLKGYAPQMARYFGLTPLAVYERQRALARLGLLSDEGRGPNRGVKAIPETVGRLLIAMLATDSLSDTDERVRKLLNAKPSPMEQALASHAEMQAHLDSGERQWRPVG